MYQSKSCPYYFTSFSLPLLTSIFFLISVGIVLGFNDNNYSYSYSSVFGIDVTKKINLSPEEAQMIFLNLERINSQIDLTAQNLKDNKTEGAFYHSYIPHSVTYPTIKQSLDNVDPSASIKLEGLLTDLPIFINSKSRNESPSSDVFSSVNLESNLNQIQKTTENLTGTHLINRVNGTNPSDILPILSNNDFAYFANFLVTIG